MCLVGADQTSKTGPDEPRPGSQGRQTGGPAAKTLNVQGLPGYHGRHCAGDRINAAVQGKRDLMLTTGTAAARVDRVRFWVVEPSGFLFIGAGRVQA